MINCICKIWKRKNEGISAEKEDLVMEAIPCWITSFPPTKKKKEDLVQLGARYYEHNKILNLYDLYIYIHRPSISSFFFKSSIYHAELIGRP